jgi:hypothetical protein
MCNPLHWLNNCLGNCIGRIITLVIIVAVIIYLFWVYPPWFANLVSDLRNMAK